MPEARRPRPWGAWVDASGGRDDTPTTMRAQHESIGPRVHALAAWAWRALGNCCQKKSVKGAPRGESGETQTDDAAIGAKLLGFSLL